VLYPSTALMACAARGSWRRRIGCALPSRARAPPVVRKLGVQALELAHCRRERRRLLLQFLLGAFALRDVAKDERYVRLPRTARQLTVASTGKGSPPQRTASSERTC